MQFTMLNKWHTSLNIQLTVQHKDKASYPGAVHRNFSLYPWPKVTNKGGQTINQRSTRQTDVQIEWTDCVHNHLIWLGSKVQTKVLLYYTLNILCKFTKWIKDIYVAHYIPETSEMVEVWFNREEEVRIVIKALYLGRLQQLFWHGISAFLEGQGTTTTTIPVQLSFFIGWVNTKPILTQTRLPRRPYTRIKRIQNVLEEILL